MYSISALEAAFILSTPPNNIYRLLNKGKIRAVKSNPIRIEKDELLRYLQSRVPSSVAPLKWRGEV